MKNASKVDCLVIGAGIIGLSLALELQKSGRQVLVIDKGEPGLGCSYGNAGWITPCFAMPLPQPGMFLKSIGWLLNPDSPLHIKPQPSWLLARWMLGFLAAMNEKRMRQSIAVLTDISKYSLTAYKEMADRQPSTFGYDQKGLLMVSRGQEGFRAAELEMQLMLERGIPGKSLSRDAVIDLEPALKPDLAGGVYFPSEAHSEPLETVKATVREFEAAGGRIQTKTEVYDFSFAGDKISAVHTTRGNFNADLVVLATGSWSRVIAQRLGTSVPMLGGKGYSLITNDFDTRPSHPIMIVEKKIAVTPRNGSVRLAGTLELVNGDDSISTRRMNNILNGAQDYMHMKSNPVVSEIWRGLRPCTPDGVPLIGFSKKWSNLFYNAGHQMLGLQSAPGSARLGADIIMNRTPIADAKPFDPARYGG
jgi:D-amino-acid dehydrogenase